MSIRYRKSEFGRIGLTIMGSLERRSQLERYLGQNWGHWIEGRAQSRGRIRRETWIEEQLSLRAVRS